MWGEQTSLLKDCYRETDFRGIVSQVGQESGKKIIFNTICLYLVIINYQSQEETERVRGGGIESLVDCIK